MIGTLPVDTSRKPHALHDLLATIGEFVIVGDANPMISAIEYDSRRIRPGALFAALPGSDFDGHAYIGNAVSQGAVTILCEHPVDLPLHVPQIVVADSRAALAQIAAAFHANPSRQMQTIGITGTDGKTSTSYILESILQFAGRTTGVIGTVGVRIGAERSYDLGHQTTPESNLVQAFLREMADSKVDDAIIEATSHGLAMHRLDGTEFRIAGVTNITHEHLEFHKTIEQYRNAKAMLVERTAALGGVVVLNADDEGARSMASAAHGAETHWFSMLDDRAEIHALDVVSSRESLTFTLTMFEKSYPVRLPMIGTFNVANALLASGISHAAGVSSEVIANALDRPVEIPGRLRLIDQGQPFTVVVDYAHTPDSLQKILELLRVLHTGRRVIIVTGSAGERDAGKRPMQGNVCARLADFSVFTSEDPRNEDPERIIEEIAFGARDAGGTEGVDFSRVTDRRQAIADAIAMASPGDCVLLAGKGHETSIIWGFEHRPWNESAVVMETLAARGYSKPSEKHISE